MLFDQESTSQSTSPLVGSLPLTGRLDGIIVVSLPLEDAVARRLLRLATVLVDVRHPGFDSVHTDDFAGGRLVASHLLGRGHRRFGFLGEAQESEAYVSPSQRRLAGYRAALAEAGHPLRPADVRLTGYGHAVVAARELLSGDDRPTAVFASDDTLAAGALRAARGLSDGAVVGFDDGPLAEALDLTTVGQPLEESGRTAMELILQRLERPGAVREVALGLSLVVRSSG